MEKIKNLVQASAAVRLVRDRKPLVLAVLFGVLIVAAGGYGLYKFFDKKYNYTTFEGKEYRIDDLTTRQASEQVSPPATNTDEQIKVFEQKLKDRTATVDDVKTLAQLYVIKRDFPKAIRYYEQLKDKLDPKSPTYKADVEAYESTIQQLKDSN